MRPPLTLREIAAATTIPTVLRRWVITRALLPPVTDACSQRSESGGQVIHGPNLDDLQTGAATRRECQQGRARIAGRLLTPATQHPLFEAFKDNEGQGAYDGGLWRPKPHPAPRPLSLNICNRRIGSG